MNKKLLWIVVLAVPLLCVGLLVAHTLFFDEALDAKALALGAPRPPSVPTAQNGYLSLIALAAGDGDDGATYAQAWLAETRAARENRPEKPLPARRATRPELCDPAQTSCLMALQDKTVAQAHRDRLAAYQEDLLRYEQLLAAPAYEEILDAPFRSTSPVPTYSVVMAAQRAYLGRAALDVQAGRLEAALLALERDLGFQRVMLAGARTLVGKMVAVANYRRDLAFIADLLQTRRNDLKPFATRLTAMLKPIAPGALDLGATLDNEFAVLKVALNMPEASVGLAPGTIYARLGTQYFYKPNATINAAYRHYQATAASLRQPPGELARRPLVTAPQAMTLPDYFDNPVGQLLLQAAIPSFLPYALRLHDLDACNRQLGLGAEILVADIAPDQVAAFVAKSATRFHDPYTGLPMRWDAASRQLSVQASAAQSGRQAFNVDNGRFFLQL